MTPTLRSPWAPCTERPPSASRPGNGSRAECFAGSVVLSLPSPLCPTCHCACHPWLPAAAQPAIPRLRGRRGPGRVLAPVFILFHLSLLSGRSICPSTVASGMQGRVQLPGVTGGCHLTGRWSAPPQGAITPTELWPPVCVGLVCPVTPGMPGRMGWAVWAAGLCPCVTDLSSQTGRQQLGGLALWAPPQTWMRAHWGLGRNWVPTPEQMWRVT